MLRAVAVLFVALAVPAFATPEYILPTLFDVTGVSPGDALNIRAEPDARAPVLATLAHDARGIEVVGQSGHWGRVNAGETSGWVSMRYLAYRSDVWTPGAVPEGFRCLGTEPFWDLGREGPDAVLRTPENGTGERRPIEAVLDNGLFRDPTRVIVAGNMTLVAQPQACSDGMSERMFGLSATLVIHGEQPRMLGGCCLIGE